MISLQRSRGFSLVELAVSVAILAILLTIAVPSFQAVRKHGHDRKAQALLAATADYLTSAAALRHQGVLRDLSSATLADRLSQVDASVSYIDAELGEVQESSGPEEMSVFLESPQQAVMALRSDSGTCFVVRTHMLDGVFWGTVPSPGLCDAHQPELFLSEEVTGSLSSPSELTLSE